MKINYLFPNKYKIIGWVILIPSAILGLYTLFQSYEPYFFEVKVLSLFVDEIFGEDKLYEFTYNNILNEILGILVIISSLMVAFSAEKDEDELIAKIRLDSLVWATYVNYAVLILVFIFVYELSFLMVMVFNMFTILIFFIIRFNWQIWKLKKSNTYEE